MRKKTLLFCIKRYVLYLSLRSFLNIIWRLSEEVYLKQKQTRNKLISILSPSSSILWVIEKNGEKNKFFWFIQLRLPAMIRSYLKLWRYCACVLQIKYPECRETMSNVEKLCQVFASWQQTVCFDIIINYEKLNY